MKHKQFYEQQMREEGFEPLTDAQIELYRVIGPKDYRRLSQVGFNMAYAEKALNRTPAHGSYQADMMHGQSLCEQVAYQHCCLEKFDRGWLKGFLDNLTEDACMEDLRQRIAYQRLEDTIKDNSYMADYGAWMIGDDDEGTN